MPQPNDVGSPPIGRSLRKRNSQLGRKLALRAELVDMLPPGGAVYMAYAGSCSLAAAYPGRPVYAVDHKAQTFADGIPPNVVSWVEMDCEFEFPFADDAIFSVADFDAFAMPYPGLRAFLKSGRLADRLALVFSDTCLLRILQWPQFVHYPCGRRWDLRDSGISRIEVWRRYVGDHMVPCLRSLLPGYSVLHSSEARWKNTVFWGVVVSL